MKKLLYIISLFFVLSEYGFCQFFLNGGIGKILQHSERSEPTIFADGFDWQYKVDFGYSFYIKPTKAYQVGLGYEKRVADSRSSTGLVIIEPSSLLEESVPVVVRIVWLKNQIQVGVGPMIVITKQTSTHQIGNNSDLQESIMIVSPGCSLVSRLMPVSNGEAGSFIQIEGRIARSLIEFGGGQDLSSYTHHYSQVDLSFGFQF